MFPYIAYITLIYCVYTQSYSKWRNHYHPPETLSEGPSPDAWGLGPEVGGGAERDSEATLVAEALVALEGAAAGGGSGEGDEREGGDVLSLWDKSGEQRYALSGSWDEFIRIHQTFIPSSSSSHNPNSAPSLTLGYDTSSPPFITAPTVGSPSLSSHERVPSGEPAGAWGSRAGSPTALRAPPLHPLLHPHSPSLSVDLDDELAAMAIVQAMGDRDQWKGEGQGQRDGQGEEEVEARWSSHEPSELLIAHLAHNATPSATPSVEGVHTVTFVALASSDPLGEAKDCIHAGTEIRNNCAHATSLSLHSLLLFTCSVVPHPHSLIHCLVQ